MADTSKILLLGAAGVAAYLWWSSSSPTSTAAPAPSAGGTTPPPPAPGTTPVTTPPAAQSAYNSLAAIYLRLTAQVQANSTDPAITQSQGQFSAPPEVFNYYLGQISTFALDSAGMAAVFPQGNAPVTLPNFWGPVSQYLAQNKGLSGLGLFRGLAGYGRGRR